MPCLSAAPIILTAEQESDLQRLARAHKTPRKLAERAEMILRSAAGTAVREIARQLGIWPKTVRQWRSRWLSGPSEAPVAARLADAPRSGVPETFTPEQSAGRPYEDMRHGTQTLVAAVDVAAGQITAAMGDPRTEEDYAKFMGTVFAAGAPTPKGRGIADDLNAHVSERVGRLGARLC